MRCQSSPATLGEVCVPALHCSSSRCRSFARDADGYDRTGVRAIECTNARVSPNNCEPVVLDRHFLEMALVRSHYSDSEKNAKLGNSVCTIRVKDDGGEFLRCQRLPDIDLPEHGEVRLLKYPGGSLRIGPCFNRNAAQVPPDFTDLVARHVWSHRPHSSVKEQLGRWLPGPCLPNDVSDQNVGVKDERPHWKERWRIAEPHKCVVRFAKGIGIHGVANLVADHVLTSAVA